MVAVAEPQRPRARVFISCGQRYDEEKGLGSSCKKHFERRGFSVYLAEEVQSLEALTENIFHHLKNSEYAVFIDCAREKLSSGEIRGSMFVNQELAIAAFLPIEESRVFHKEGVTIEGVAKYLIAKPIHFSSRQQFLGKLRRQTKEWRSDWRNELLLEREGKDFQDVSYVRGEARPARFYHIKVKNLHQQKIARDCVAYLERIKDLSTGEEKFVEELVEFKWKGVTTPRIAIPPKKSRYLDAFHIYYDSQNIVHLGINPFVVDFSGYYELYELKGHGAFELSYVVFSENLSPVRETFRLHIKNGLDDVEFHTRDRCGDVV